MKQYIQREPLTSDLIFKAVYGQDNSASKKALILLLNLILERTADPIVNLHYKNPFSLAENSSEKVIVMDILVETSKGEQIDIEMQIDVSGSFINRTVFYGCDLLTQGLEKGEDYAKLKKSIVICIIRNKLFPESEAPHTCFMLREQESGRELTHLLQLHYLELGKLHWEGRPPETLSPLEQVGAYLRCSGDPKQQEYIESLLKTKNEVISMTDELLKKVSEDEQLRAFRRSREMYEFDQAARRMEARELGFSEGREAGKAEGRAEGKTEGEEKAKRSIFLHMKKQGLSFEQIAKLTGLTEAEMEKF